MSFLVIYKGNSGGSVLIPDSPFHNITPEPIWYHCPVCEKAYKSLEDLRNHRIDNHPLHRPYLMIKGIPVGRDELQLKRPLILEDLVLENVEQAFLDGVKYHDFQELFNKLVANQVGRRVLSLQYQEYVAQVALTFNLITDKALHEVECAFLEVFSTQEISTQLLRSFTAKLGKLNRDNAYAGGLGCYVSGLMAKDRVPSTSLAFDQFNTKFGEALDHLESVDTSLAKSVSAVMMFARNQFTRSSKTTILPQLAITSEFMLDGQFRDFDYVQRELSARIPIDSMTETLVLFCTKGSEYRKSYSNDLMRMQKSSVVSPEDREKIIFSLMCHHLETSKEIQAVECFKKLKYSNVFAETATQVMDTNNA